MLDTLIFVAYSVLLLFVPLFWTSVNYELFEYNKMMLTYALTAIIVGAWIAKMVNTKSLLLKRTPLDIPLMLFLLANILATIFSIDKHTSIWGYYSRSNGGLLSIVSYILLYYALVSNLTKEKIFQILRIGAVGGFIVALWAIPEHFGFSPSCAILRGQFNTSCWIQDVQARVFATLGQPNWLAAYLGMLIFPVLYFLLVSSPGRKLLWYLVLIAYYLAFTFTYSRGGTLGLLAGVGVFVILALLVYLKGRSSSRPRKAMGFDWMLIVLGTFLFINLVFGSALVRFDLAHFFTDLGKVSQTAPKSQPGTQLENEGTESGVIRWIVWQGAISIFKAYPIFGSGVETFAYSYYNFRPTAHNMTSEWDFLYNKAHNEYLNYLATTGLAGIITYLTVILTFIVWGLAFLIRYKERLRDMEETERPHLFLVAILAGYVSYLVQNFVSFSVVIIAILFYLFPALAFTSTDSLKSYSLPKSLNLISKNFRIIYKRALYTHIVRIFILLMVTLTLLSLFRFWEADTIFAKAMKNSEAGNAGIAYNLLIDATRRNSIEPLYKSELAYSEASVALALADKDATLSAKLKNEAVNDTEDILKHNPKNINYWRTAIKTYYQLSGLGSDYTYRTLETIDKTIELAPTDPKLYYNRAVLLGQVDQNNEAIKTLQKTIYLKPDYREAYVALALFYFDARELDKATATIKTVLNYYPQDAEVLKYLQDWGNKGVATSSSAQAKPQ